MKISFYSAYPNNPKSYIIIYVSWKDENERKHIKRSIEYTVPKGCLTVSKAKDQEPVYSCKKSYSNSVKVNQRIRKLQDEITTYFNKQETNELQPKESEIMEIIDSICKTGNVKRSNGKTFLEYYKEFYDKSLNGERRSPQGLPIKKDSCKPLFTVYKDLGKFENETGFQLSFQSMNKQFIGKYLKYLEDHEINRNTVLKRIKILKIFLKWAKGENLHKNSEYESQFTYSGGEITRIVLSLDELEKINKLDFNEVRTLIEVGFNEASLQRDRDLLLILCYSGMRISDLKGLQPENIDKEAGKIRLIQVKTGSPAVIPIHKFLRAIFEKYNWDIPKPTSKFNPNIKEVCRLAGINEIIVKNKNVGNQPKSKNYEKWEKVSSQIGRRSYNTNSILIGEIQDNIMKASGHKSKSAFQIYVNIAEEIASNSLKNKWDSIPTNERKENE